MQPRPRPERPPVRTDLPYEYEIVDFLDGRVEPGLSCSTFEFTVLTESLEANIPFRISWGGSRQIPWVLSTGHVINNVYYVVHPYSFMDLCRDTRTAIISMRWPSVFFEFRSGTRLHRVDILLRLMKNASLN
jgi:hypothetical protein